MKTFFQRILALAAVAAVLQWSGVAFAQFYGYGGSPTEQRAVLTIKADGSSVFTSEVVSSRTLAEQQLRMMEQFKKMRAAEEAGEEPPKPDLTSTNETKPLTDEELAQKLTESMNERYGEDSEDSGQKYTVAVRTNSVAFTTTRSFASLEELMKDGYGIWREGGVIFENARFETDTNGLLRLTLTPASGMERYLKSTRSQMKLIGAKTEFKIIFPGKVISSGFPAIENSATGLSVDGKNDASVDAMLKFYAAPTVITAEAGGLKLEQPLESKKLMRSGRARGAKADDQPITDAGPGFVAEAQNLTTTTLHIFPGGEDYYKENGGSSQSGAIVSAKLFAPKGRTLKSVSGVRVLTAVDNKGRSVVEKNEAGDENDAFPEFSHGGNEDSAAMEIELRLKLPEPDAQAIDEISAEAVAVTVGKWKEMTLTNLQQNATNEVDLSTVLPGAKMVVTKFSAKNGQVNLTATFKGPKTVEHLDLRANIPGNEHFNSNFNERNSTTKGGTTTRTVNLNGYGERIEIDSNTGTPVSNDGATQAIVLIVRYPDDLRRERVKFNLKGLDLL